MNELMGLYYYGYRTAEGAVGLNFIIAPDADTAWSLVAGLTENAPPEGGISQVGGVICEGPARMMAGYGVMMAN